MIIQKNDLQIAKIKRIKYGSYTPGIMTQCDFSEAEPDKIIMKQYFLHKKKLVQEKQLELKQKLVQIQEVVQNKDKVKQLDVGKNKDVQVFDKSQLIKNKLIK